jgi:hypothetical protein
MPHLHQTLSFLKDNIRCVFGSTDSKQPGRKRIYFEESKMNRSDMCHEVGAYVYDEWRLVNVGH